MSFWKALQKLGRPLMVVLLALAVLTPTVDVYACANDKAPSAVTASSVQAKAMDHKNTNIPIERHDDGDSGCIHGHCHHGIGVAKLNEVQNVAQTMALDTVMPWSFDTPSSAPPLDLLRPPRG